MVVWTRGVARDSLSGEALHGRPLLRGPQRWHLGQLEVLPVSVEVELLQLDLAVDYPLGVVQLLRHLDLCTIREGGRGARTTVILR